MFSRWTAALCHRDIPSRSVLEEMIRQSYFPHAEVVQLGGAGEPVANWSGWVEDRLHKDFKDYRDLHVFAFVPHEVNGCEVFTKRWNADTNFVGHNNHVNIGTR